MPPLICCALSGVIRLSPTRTEPTNARGGHEEKFIHKVVEGTGAAKKATTIHVVIQTDEYNFPPRFCPIPPQTGGARSAYSVGLKNQHRIGVLGYWTIGHVQGVQVLLGTLPEPTQIKP